MTAPVSFSSTDVVLRDGSTVRLRALGPGDAPGLAALFDELSPESLYSRFFTLPKSSGPEIARLMKADGDSAVVLVAELAGRLVAVAGYERAPDRPHRAEVAFAITDRLQGRGVGTRMLEMLAEIGRARAVTDFDAYVLAGNERMMRVFLDSGFEVASRLDAGVLHVVLSLAPTPHFQELAAERSLAAATASMKAFFEPRSVAVIGANRRRGKIGAEVLHNLIGGGFAGPMFAVHPSADRIDGIPAYPSIGAIPGEVDLAVVCVPADLVLPVADDCIAKGVKAMVVVSAGFGETGRAGRAREDALVSRIRDAGIRLVGPNCMGLMNMDPAVRLNVTFAPVTPPSGHVAMSTQSGALGLAILDYARALHIGLSSFVSVGNKADVSSNDLLQYWATDPNTHVILLYLESFGNPRKFSQIARRVSRRKPIVAVKAGRSASGARAAASHTGALASSDAIVDALFEQAGVIRTTTIEELFAVATLLAHQPVPRGRSVAILTNAGGPGILAADACEAHGLVLPSLAEPTIAELRSFLPASAAVGNPVDMIASATAAQYERALSALLVDGNVDSVLVIFIPPLVTRPEDVAEAVRRASLAHPEKTVAGIFMSANGAPPELSPIPCYAFPESAAVALAHAARRGQWLMRPEGTPASLTDLDEAAVRRLAADVLGRGGGWLTPAESQSLLAAVGIRTASAETVMSEEAAVAAAARMGYPVVLKAIGPEIIHKSEVGGVILDLGTDAALAAAWRDLKSRLGARMTAALVQEMVTGGVEMLVGATEDPTFGPVIACAMGGTLAELLADSAFRLHPLTEQDAAAMIDGLRGARLLRGFRGAATADEGALRDCLLRVSALVGLCPEIQELDINPLRVLPQGARALDVRVRIEHARPRPASRRVTY